MIKMKNIVQYCGNLLEWKDTALSDYWAEPESEASSSAAEP